ncbi:hypothetical protein [Actinoplanes ianthinogenes]|uniref:hypothetical protein n=1 Tax=Actinoplanes ianthinogenes TaxID=122358 RepID=UPI00166F93B8|nr:hypothetical protein [Actinoplanes ianthinogenes]
MLATVPGRWRRRHPQPRMSSGPLPVVCLIAFAGSALLVAFAGPGGLAAAGATAGIVLGAFLRRRLVADAETEMRNS